MNIVKIQTDLLKDAFNIKSKHKWAIKEINGKDEVILFDYRQMWIIPQTQFVLDIKTLNALGVIDSNIDISMIQDYYLTGVQELFYTGNMRLFGSDTCIELTTGIETFYVSKHFLKYYDKSVSFYGTKISEPIYVVENERLVGLIMPYKACH